jgi:hypothetical protein
MTIEIFDEKDRDILCECVLWGIRDLAELKARASIWGCSELEMQDRIVRLKRLLNEISGAE